MPKTMERTANRLINEKSPYLLQHAHNPVDWYSWSDEAFGKAKTEDKPVFLSIGYSTCHWCHVMERESFEDEEVAEVLNKHFISIKVDREERADIDSIYMTFCQLYTGSGGWPLTVILTPDKKPFFAGTYFPKKSRHGSIGLIELLNKINDVWENDREKFNTTCDEMLKEIKKYDKNNDKEELNEKIINNTALQLKQYFQREYGGFSRAPKFPVPHNLYFLLRYYYQNKDHEVLKIIEKNLQCMYKGGIFDHIGFGFSRYSTDNKWLVPHFEKMLYDNALLSLVYAETYSLTGNKQYEEVAEKIYTYLLRDMLSSEGAFYSAEDADSEGIEGKFYVWTLDELMRVLGDEEGKIYAEIYDITIRGNFEGKSIPNLIDGDLEKMQKDTELQRRLENSRKKLFEYREKRVHPFKDDKILTSWNGLAIASFSNGGKIFKKPDYIKVAKKSADFILNKLVNKDGRLLARYRDGEAASLAVLEDYAFLVWGLIELYEACFDTKYLEKAIELNEKMIELFWDKDEGGFYLYGKDSEELILRPKEIYDGALPSGNSVALLNLIKLNSLTGSLKYEEFIEKQINVFSGTVKENPIGYVNFITAFMYNISSIREIVIAGNIGEEFVEKSLDIINDKYNPFQSIILNNGDSRLYKINSLVEIQGKAEGKSMMFICENFTCGNTMDNIEQVERFFN
ncbi:thioredoxin domain-containing protein [Clostridium sp. YIM B02551]|uniref:thioredoxin domain-containing protein n=1 Tax=Clostridium sp. YIM B02551 TaxID=2910679 RepID=UPI0035A09C6C